MIPQANQNAAGSKISVTTTATNIFSLINTSAGTTLSRAGFDVDVDSIDIMAENGSIRILYDGNTPTSTNGELIPQSVLKQLRGINLVNLKLIGVSGSVNCSIVLGKSKANEPGGAANLLVSSGGGSGGTQYAEDSVAISGDTGTVALAVRNDAGTALAADGDYTFLQTDSSGNLRVTGGGSSFVDDAAFTPGTTSISPVGFMFDDVAPDSVNEGDAGIGRMSANRNQYETIRDAAGNERGANVTAANELNVIATAQPGVDVGDVTVNNAAGASAVNIQDGGNSITVDGTVGVSGTVTATVSQSVGTNLHTVVDSGAVTVSGTATVTGNKAEDDVASSGDSGLPILGVRNDTGTSKTTADGDYSMIATDSAGRVGISDLGGSITVDGTVTVSGGSTSLADDSAFTVGTTTVTPVGFLADETASDSVDEGDIGAARMTLDRKQITAGSYVDDTAFTPAGTSSYVQMMGAQADETSADSVDEGDAGALRMTLTRFLKTSGGDLSAGEDLTNNVLGVQIKPAAIATYSPTTYTNLGTATTANIKASTGNVFSISIINTNAAARYFQLFNSTSSTATVVYCWTIPAGGALIVGNDFFTNAGINFSTGITWGVSTTFLTFTAATAAEHVTAVNYI